MLSFLSLDAIWRNPIWFSDSHTRLSSLNGKNLSLNISVVGAHSTQITTWSLGFLMNMECLRKSIHVQICMGWINTSTMGNQMSHAYFSSQIQPETVSMTFICLTLRVPTSPFLRPFTFLSQKQTNKQKIFPCVGLVQATQLLWAHGQWRPYFNLALPNSGFYNCTLNCMMEGIRESLLPSASILRGCLYCKTSPGFSSQEGEVKWTRHGLEANW